VPAAEGAPDRAPPVRAPAECPACGAPTAPDKNGGPAVFCTASGGCSAQVVARLPFVLE
jgi:NAD-dependent DNA ligase